MRRFAQEAKKEFTEIAHEAQTSLLAYDWPGNVRELANVIERAIVLGPGPKITPQDLSPRLVTQRSRRQSGDLSYREDVDAYRRQLISRVLAQAQGNRAAAAKLLGLQRTYLSRLIKTLQIE